MREGVSSFSGLGCCLGLLPTDTGAMAEMHAVDLDDPCWPARACEQLRRQSFARLRLSPDEVRLVHELYDSVREAFDFRASRNQLRVCDRDFDDLDSRNGFVDEPNREWLELHCSTPANFDREITDPAARRAWDYATKVARFCRGKLPTSMRQSHAATTHCLCSTVPRRSAV